MMVNANRSEVVLKTGAHSPAGIVEKSTLPGGEYLVAGLASDFENPEIRIQSELEYNLATKSLPEHAHRVDTVEPYYLKKPNIT